MRLLRLLGARRTDARRRAFAAALLLAALLGGGAAARAAGTASGRAGGGGEGDDLAVMVTRQGAMMRARFEGRRLVARDAAGSVLASREITGPERQQLLDATRAALTDDAPQWSCPVDETFVAATVDGRTLSSAVCPERNHWRAHPELWRRLLSLVRRLLGAAS